MLTTSSREREREREREKGGKKERERAQRRKPLGEIDFLEENFTRFTTYCLSSVASFVYILSFAFMEKL